MTELLPQLRDLVSNARWEDATDLLRQNKPDEAADAVVALPFEQQRLLFRRLPTELAARIAEHSPYFHAYVLLHSLNPPKIAAIVDAMHPGEREEFLDALPEETWQSLMKMLEEARLGTSSTPTEAPETPKEPAPELPPDRSTADHRGATDR